MTSSPAPERPDYNPIFERFVTPGQMEEQVLPGMVAYCLYKIAKREWATIFFARHGRKPSDAELNEYILTWTDSRIVGAQKEADAVLLAFASSVIDESAPRIREDALRGTFWGSVRSSIAAAFLYTLVLIGIVMILRFSGIDLVSIFQALEPKNVSL